MCKNRYLSLFVSFSRSRLIFGGSDFGIDLCCFFYLFFFFFEFHFKIRVVVVAFFFFFRFCSSSSFLGGRGRLLLFLRRGRSLLPTSRRRTTTVASSSSSSLSVEQCFRLFVVHDLIFYPFNFIVSLVPANPSGVPRRRHLRRYPRLLFQSCFGENQSPSRLFCDFR